MNERMTESMNDGWRETKTSQGKKKKCHSWDLLIVAGCDQH